MTEARSPGDHPTDPVSPGRDAEPAPGVAPPPQAEQAAGGVAPAPQDDQAPGGVTPEQAAGNAVADELDELVAELRRERDEYLGLAQRAKADFENFRKRAAREAADAERRGRAALARDLLPSIDNLERALAAAEQSSEVARGVVLVHDELRSTLARAGVESFDPTGESFDPAAHEAVSTHPGSDGVEPGTIVETLERGYRVDGQLLRPARVVVSE